MREATSRSRWDIRQADREAFLFAHGHEPISDSGGGSFFWNRSRLMMPDTLCNAASAPGSRLAAIVRCASCRG